MFQSNRFALVLAVSLAACTFSAGFGEPVSTPADAVNFPAENFTQMNPTLPNSLLDFNDDTSESCCARDYSVSGVNTAPPPVPEFEGNPLYKEKADPSFLVECQKYSELPELVANQTVAPDYAALLSKDYQTVASWSNNIANRKRAEFVTVANPKMTGHFHISAVGGESSVRLQDVKNYSVCMARGGNVAMAINTDSASILSYNGNDHIYLAGNNTNMLTRTGAGQDIIEVHQAKALSAPSGAYKDARGENWAAYNIYKTALSGSTGVDTVEIKDTPTGTKWCHIGGYYTFGEYFYVVEFALPPSVTEGPRRQRINIGKSVEYVVFKGRKYSLREFLVHGSPMDAVARSIPVGAPLPNVPATSVR